MGIPEDIKPRIAKLIVLLGSDQAGEISAAVAALKRLLGSHKLTLHDLSASLLGHGAMPTENRFENEIREALGYGAWLGSHETKFLNDMLRRVRLGGSLTEKQANWLAAILSKVERWRD